ncbi:MAG: hypothetical protein JSR33_06160 [Proteobacteria bacterium]|nr:hypothetical protein [Pseudomonadota bacterium]
MRKIEKLLILGLFAAMLLLSSCAHFRTVENHKFMKYAVTVPPLIVPEGIPNPEAESYYPVPPVALTAPAGTLPPVTPPGLELQRYINKPNLPPPA